MPAKAPKSIAVPVKPRQVATPTGKGAHSRMARYGHYDYTEYTEDRIADLYDYFAVDPMRERATSYKIGKRTVRKVYREAVELPTIDGFCAKHNLYRSLLDAWAQKYPRFAQAIDQCRAHQARILIHNGLMGHYNTSFATMAAKNLIGWRDKFDVEVGGNIIVQLKDFVIDDPKLVSEKHG